MQQDDDKSPRLGTAEDISLRAIAAILSPYRKLIAALTGVATLIAVVFSLLVPPWFTATTKILPPQQTQSTAATILGQLGGLLGGASQAIGLKNPNDIYVAMLKSRTVSDRIIEKFNLKTVYDEKLDHFARRELAKHASVVAGRDSVITIEFEDKSPERARDIANAYVEELRALTSQLAISEAGQRRLFFENQLVRAKNDLANAEVELQRYTTQFGLINPQGQLGVSVATAAALKANISAKEIQLAGIRSFATNANPDVQRIQQEIVGLKSELAKLEQRGDADRGDIFVPFGKAPEVGMGYVRKYRDVKYFETLFEVLAKNYELARIDEARDATLIQVLDLAVVPDHRSYPKRTLIVASTAIVTAVAALLLCSLLHSFGLGAKVLARFPIWLRT